MFTDFADAPLPVSAISASAEEGVDEHVAPTSARLAML
jgi:hypothetical protein